MKKVIENFSKEQKAAIGRVLTNPHLIVKILFDTTDGTFEWVSEDGDSDELEFFEEDRKLFVNLFLLEEHSGCFEFDDANADVQSWLWDSTQEDEDAKPKTVTWEYNPRTMNIEFECEVQDGTTTHHIDECYGKGYESKEVEDYIKYLKSIS